MHLWIRPLKKDALALLSRPGLLPPAHQVAIADGDTAGARCALKCPELRTLHHTLLGLADTRNPKAIRHPYSGKKDDCELPVAQRVPLAKANEEIAHGAGAGKAFDAQQGVKGLVCAKPVGVG